MKHYLVIQLARFGDLLQTKRLLATLLARGDGQVHLCLDNSLQSLATIVFPQVQLHPITAHGTGLSREQAYTVMFQDNRSAFAELKARQFDEVYNLNFSPLNFRLAALFDPDTVRGHAWHNGQEISSQWARMAMQWSRLRRQSINLVDFWAYYCRDAVAPATVNPKATPQGDNIGIVLSGRESRRSIPLELLSKYATALARLNKSGRILLLGSLSEKHAGKTLLKSLTKDVAEKTDNLAGKTDWKDLVDALGSMKQILTPDTGTMHLAAHLGIPVTAFFLSSAWCFETGPYGEGHTVFQAIRDCLPCLESDPCPHKIACLNGFADPNFIRFMITEKTELVPPGINAYTTQTDDFGVDNILLAGNDPDKAARDEFKKFLGRHVGQGCPLGDNAHQLAMKMYRDKDWATRPSPESRRIS
jgi:ADP-heptose:LPS heptosyltransferase